MVSRRVMVLVAVSIACVVYACDARAEGATLGVGVDVAGMPAVDLSPPFGDADEMVVSAGLGVVGNYMFDAPDRGGFLSFATIFGWRDASFRGAGGSPIVVRANSMLGYRVPAWMPIEFSMGLTFVFVEREAGVFPDGSYSRRFQEPLMLPTLGVGTVWSFDRLDVGATVRMEMLYPSGVVTIGWRFGS